MEVWGDTEAVPSRPRKSERITKDSSNLPVSHLGASQAGHGFFQVLSKIQNILYCPLSLRLWIWQGEQKEVVNEKDFLKAPGSQGRGDRHHISLIIVASGFGLGRFFSQQRQRSQARFPVVE